MTPENRPGPDATNAEAETTQNRNCDLDSIAGARRQQFDPLAANGRRHGHSRRMPPTGPWGCKRDPEHDRHRCSAEVSDHMAEAAVAAIRQLDALGSPGLLDERNCRAMWRIGYRQLAVDVHRRTSGAA